MIILQQAPEYLRVSAYITGPSYTIISFKLPFLWLACLHPTLLFPITLHLVTLQYGIFPQYSTGDFKWNHLLTATLIFHLFLPACDTQNHGILWWSPPLYIHHSVVPEDLKLDLMIRTQSSFQALQSSLWVQGCSCSYIKWWGICI